LERGSISPTGLTARHAANVNQPTPIPWCDRKSINTFDK
jgi:hypothetical protein